MLEIFIVKFSVRLLSSRARARPEIVTTSAAILRLVGMVICWVVKGGMRLVIR